MNIKPTEQQIDATLNKASEGIDKGSKWPGQSYEEGVKDAIEWLLGYTDSDPMGDE